MYLSYRGVFFFWLDAMTPPLSRGRLQQKIIPKAFRSEHLLQLRSAQVLTLQDGPMAKQLQTRQEYVLFILSRLVQAKLFI